MLVGCCSRRFHGFFLVHATFMPHLFVFSGFLIVLIPHVIDREEIRRHCRPIYDYSSGNSEWQLELGVIETRSLINTPCLSPVLIQCNDIILQHDNTRSHALRFVTDHLHNNNVDIRNWLAVSPDLSPNKCAWDEMERRLGRQPNHSQALNELERDFWIISDDLKQRSTSIHWTIDLINETPMPSCRQCLGWTHTVLIMWLSKSKAVTFGTEFKSSNLIRN